MFNLLKNQLKCYLETRRLILTTSATHIERLSTNTSKNKTRQEIGLLGVL